MSVLSVKDSDYETRWKKFKEMINLIKHILTHLENNEPIVIATIISHRGSAPRKTGSKMIISPSGATEGTIGGGVLEAKVIEKAVGNFKTPISELIRFSLTADDAAAMGMECGGEVDVLMELVLPTEENKTLFSKWTDDIKNKQNSLMLTAVPQAPVSPEDISRGIWTKAGTAAGVLPPGTDSIEDQLRALEKQKIAQLIAVNGGFVMVEPALVPKALYIYGAGHVAIPTAEFAAKVGFDVCVMDDREEFADPDRFDGAIDARAIPSFEQALSDISIEAHDFIVIVTRGHLHDKIVLAQALRTNAAYIGMIGSRKKRDTIYTALLDEGFCQADIDRVKCPIGLSIKAQTPEEIAISIVAELIEKRAGLAS